MRLPSIAAREASATRSSLPHFPSPPGSPRRARKPPELTLQDVVQAFGVAGVCPVSDALQVRLQLAGAAQQPHLHVHTDRRGI